MDMIISYNLKTYTEEVVIHKLVLFYNKNKKLKTILSL